MVSSRSESSTIRYMLGGLLAFDAAYHRDRRASRPPPSMAAAEAEHLATSSEVTVRSVSGRVHRDRIPTRSDRTLANRTRATLPVNMVSVPQIGSSPGPFVRPRCMATTELTDNTNR